MGNTDHDTKTMGKNWCFTINNWGTPDEDFLQNLICRYLLVSKEVGEAGTPHLQGLVCFEKNMRLSACKKLHPKAHWEMCRGDVAQNQNYIRKLDSEVLVEKGLPPASRSAVGAAAAAARRKEYEEAVSLVRGGGLIRDVNPEFQLRFFGTLKRIRMDIEYRVDTLEGALCNEWHYGEPGTGKSKHVRETYPNAYIKGLNKWWDDYADEDVVIIEEVCPTHNFLDHFMKIWSDRYKFRAEIKGGSIVIRPRKIVITSNYSIDECISGVDAAAIKRRFKVKKYQCL